jgi:hypothetical protein
VRARHARRAITAHPQHPKFAALLRPQRAPLAATGITTTESHYVRVGRMAALVRAALRRAGAANRAAAPAAAAPRRAASLAPEHTVDIPPNEHIVPFVLHKASRLRDKPAVIDGATGGVMTYGSLARRVTTAMAELRRRGFKVGASEGGGGAGDVLRRGRLRGETRVRVGSVGPAQAMSLCNAGGR